MLKYLTEGEIKLQQESRGVTSGEVFSKVFESRKKFHYFIPEEESYVSSYLIQLCSKGIPRLRGE